MNLIAPGGRSRAIYRAPNGWRSTVTGTCYVMARPPSSYCQKCDVPTASSNVRFSNRPIRVKRFQTNHDCGVDVARGLVLLSGIGTKALPSWDSRTRWNNLLGGLAVKRR